ncbi:MULTISPECIES: Rz1-like lysis system protein LysC [Burkholderiaceae]|uniref:Rz1-like lysis system protein LysC n=1 Tax=Burkholderiaceae TaxID=119060 RepID=UPI001C37817D|nr:MULTISPECIES: Rz1-like lysis system protein LysC [Burkholderiaceae]MCG1017375.1 Rz1-like lysis system protein LysC [Mycetohabitans sp. B4]
MTTRPFAPGPLLLCLTMLCACTPAPPLPAPKITLNECARVSPCTMPSMAPRTNGELAESLSAARAAWAACAAQVDMIVKCQVAHRDE